MGIVWQDGEVLQMLGALDRAAFGPIVAFDVKNAICIHYELVVLLFSSVSIVFR